MRTSTLMPLSASELPPPNVAVELAAAELADEDAVVQRAQSTDCLVQYG